MFTGLVEAMGTLASREGARLRFSCPFAGDLSIGESVCVSGVCLTVEEHDDATFHSTAVPATMRRTSLGTLSPGSFVNLERALRADGRFGGHIVQGHVDGVGRLETRTPDGEWEVLQFSANQEVLRYVVPRGSIAIDGVSLTVAQRDGNQFSVAVIPHTAAVTTLGRLLSGAAANLEADVVAKYLEGLLAAAR